MNQHLLNILPTFFKTRKAFTSIKTLPISIWWEITEGGSFEKLVIKGKYSNFELYDLYLNLLQEYYDHFGTTERHKAFIEAKFNYAKNLAKWISSQDQSDRMFLEMAKIDFEEFTPNVNQEKEEYKLSEAVSVLEEVFGFAIDEDKLSTYKFYSRQKRIVEKNKLAADGKNK